MASKRQSLTPVFGEASYAAQPGVTLTSGTRVVLCLPQLTRLIPGAVLTPVGSPEAEAGEVEAVLG